MGMVVIVTVMTVTFARAVRRQCRDLGRCNRRPAAGRVFAIVSLLLWNRHHRLRRFIAYTITDFEAERP